MTRQRMQPPRRSARLATRSGSAPARTQAAVWDGQYEDDADESDFARAVSASYQTEQAEIEKRRKEAAAMERADAAADAAAAAEAAATAKAIADVEAFKTAEYVAQEAARGAAATAAAQRRIDAAEATARAAERRAAASKEQGDRIAAKLQAAEANATAVAARAAADLAARHAVHRYVFPQTVYYRRPVHHVLQKLHDGSEAAVRAAFSTFTVGELRAVVGNDRCRSGDHECLVDEAMEIFEEALKQACTENSSPTLRKLASALDPSLQKKSPSQLCAFFRRRTGFAQATSSMMEAGGMPALTAKAKKALDTKLAPVLRAVDEAMKEAGEAAREATAQIAPCRGDGRTCFAVLAALHDRYVGRHDMRAFRTRLQSIVCRLLSVVSPYTMQSLRARIACDLSAAHHLRPDDVEIGELSVQERRRLEGQWKELAPVIKKSLTKHFSACTSMRGAKKTECLAEKKRLTALLTSPRGFMDAVYSH